MPAGRPQVGRTAVSVSTAYVERRNVNSSLSLSLSRHVGLLNVGFGMVVALGIAAGAVVPVAVVEDVLAAGWLCIKMLKKHLNLSGWTHKSA